jgi:undecaprenyl-phosphate 4-deoxy-4-formamido-L-arabinose transferase
MGVILFGIGLVGEYVGRIYMQVRGRPRYVVQAVLQQDAEQQNVVKQGAGKPHAQPLHMRQS